MDPPRMDGKLTLMQRLERMKRQTARKKEMAARGECGGGSEHTNSSNDDKENNSILSSSILPGNRTAPAGDGCLADNSVLSSASALPDSSIERASVSLLEDNRSSRESRRGAEPVMTERAKWAEPAPRRRSKSSAPAVEVGGGECVQPMAVAPIPCTPSISSRPRPNTSLVSHAMPTPSLLRSASLSNCSLTGRQRITVNSREYTVLSLLGRGGSSRVFQVFDEELSKNLAVKEVDLPEHEDARAAYLNEIEHLKRLQHSRHVIRMLDYEVRAEENRLYVVLEKGDVDLATYLKTRRNDITPTFIRFQWEEILKCVKVIHDQKIIHSDLKPANFLLVEGHLKLIDFGIASKIPSNKTSVVKDGPMGTLSYMSPEALEEDDFCFKVSAKSDVWSLGCILYNMVYGRTPFEQYKNQMAKIRAICNEGLRIEFPPCDDPLLVDVLKRCLVRDVKKRASVDELLRHSYLASAGSSCSTATSSSSPSISPRIDEAIDDLAAQLSLRNFTPRTTAKKLHDLISKAKGGNTKKLTFETPEPTA